MQDASVVTAQQKRAWLPMVWAALPILAFIVVEMLRVAPTIVINNVDYFPPVDRALALSFRSLDGWVNQIHPVGFPWLIRLGLALGWDAARIGQGISIAGGVLGLVGTYLLALSMFREHRWAVIAQAFVAATNIFLYFGSVEGNDMPAAGLQVLSLGVLAISASSKNSLRVRGVLLAGGIAGLAYLIRYNGMMTAGASVLWLIALAIHDRRPAAWKATGLYIGAFVLVTALQWIPSWMATGNPLYVDQGQNVWFHLYGKTDFIIEFQQAPKGITVAQLFVREPVLFIEHWWASFQRFWVAPELTLLDAPLKLFAQAGFVFLLLASGPAAPRLRGLLALFVLAHLASLSMMRLDRRFLIVMIPLLSIGAVYFFASLIPPRWERRRLILSFNVVALLVGLAWAAQTPVGFVQGRPKPDKAITRASNILRAAGMSAAHQVLSTHTTLQDVGAPTRERFAQAYWLTPNLASVADVAPTMRSRGSRFLIYDRETGAAVMPALQGLLSPETRPPGLAPIYFPDDRQFVIYRLAESQDCLPVNTRFENKVTLECYEARVSQDVPAGSGWRVSVYLNWRTEARLDASLKVFVHLLNSEGKLVAQDDSVPALWTYPTDEWKPGEVIVDFHEFVVDASVPPGAFTLWVGLYDPDTGARVTTGADDRVALTQITINK